MLHLMSSLLQVLVVQIVLRGVDNYALHKLARYYAIVVLVLHHLALRSLGLQRQLIGQIQWHWGNF